MSDVCVRDVVAGDLPAVLALNASAVPHVNGVSLGFLERFVETGFYFRVATLDDVIVGFLLGLTAPTDYGSPNFLAFRRWFSNFVYVDRIVVDQYARRGGLAHRLYADLERKSRVVAPLLTCEVNLRPHNAASLRFHAREGFAQVGTQKTDNGRKTVALLMKHLR